MGSSCCRRVIDTPQTVLPPKEDSNKIIVPFIGPSFQGKSTLFKQLRLIYGEDYSKEELKTFRDHIRNNIFNEIKIISKHVGSMINTFNDKNEMNEKDIALTNAMEKIKDFDENLQNEDITQIHFDAIRFIWNQFNERKFVRYNLYNMNCIVYFY